MLHGLRHEHVKRLNTEPDPQSIELSVAHSDRQSLSRVSGRESSFTSLAARSFTWRSQGVNTAAAQVGPHSFPQSSWAPVAESMRTAKGRQRTSSHLEESEGCPFQLVCPFGRLDQAHKAGLPDLQDKKRRWYPLKREGKKDEQRNNTSGSQIQDCPILTAGGKNLSVAHPWVHLGEESLTVNVFGTLIHHGGHSTKWLPQDDCRREPS